MIGYSKCNEYTMTMYEQGTVNNYINTTCNCTVTSHHSGKLRAKTITCINVITVINTAGTLNKSLCNNEILIDVYPGSELFLNFKPVNRATTVSQIPHQIVSIFFQGPGTSLSLPHVTISLLSGVLRLSFSRAV